MVFDVGLLGMDGFDVCCCICVLSVVPVLFLIARDGEIDRVLGLELGVDDYVTKPFLSREVVARVKVILWRGEIVVAFKGEVMFFEVVFGIVVDIFCYEVVVYGVFVVLVTWEFELFVYLVCNFGFVFIC